MSAALKIDRTKFSAQALADIATIERLMAQSKRAGLSADDKRVLRIVAGRAPLSARAALVAHVDRLLGREGIAPAFAAAPRAALVPAPAPGEPVGPFLSIEQREKFVDDVLSVARSTYELPNGERIQGEAYSRLQSELAARWSTLPGGRRWRGVSNVWTFDEALRVAGFKVVEARVVRYFRGGGAPKAGQRCRVVTL